MQDIYDIQLSNLFTLENSGISLNFIKNLKLMICALPYVKSGCSSASLENSLEKNQLRGVTIIPSTSNNCLGT